MLGMILGICEFCIETMATAMAKKNMIEQVIYPHCCTQEAGSAVVSIQPT